MLKNKQVLRRSLLEQVQGKIPASISQAKTQKLEINELRNPYDIFVRNTISVMLNSSEEWYNLFKTINMSNTPQTGITQYTFSNLFSTQPRPQPICACQTIAQCV